MPKCAGEGHGEKSIPLAVLHILIQHEQPLAAAEIAQLIDEDDYDVEKVLEYWIEFLQQQQLDGEIRYSLYHSSFRHFLKSTAYP
ncbi:hypothetical protein IQ257_27610 [Coleofasciculus sp. LEGE 07092]|nr:hypothetical protein [Coleofasciculus sp. LEGE 07092]